ncbi:MAG: ABC transporter ATP-binding protein [Thermoplasmatales archaeon]|jgi:ATP-binding cassette subfamily B protein|nr:ABC transporter ATP-binding protein/permease [Candidatus Thermoplasmatota archaeon]MCL6002043.1 ABC transporter ATP-binding protein/permease [Candidatus Thermoplasmatota archaeon]MDA8054616.1 ABC transporter ATP-binding protein [Thermoplasmatales archaeon]
MSTGYDAVEDQFLKPEKGSRTMSRMVKDIFYWRRDSGVFTASVVVTAIAGVLYPLALGLAVNSILSGNTLLLFGYSTMFFLLYVVQFFSNRSMSVSATKVAQGVIKRMRDRSFQNLQRVPLDFYSKVKAGYLISRIENDSESISDFLTYQLPQVISGITTIIIAAGIMFYFDARLALYSLLVMPILGIFTLAIQTKVRANYLRTRRTIAAITGNLAETIAAIRTVKAFNAESQTEGRFEQLNSDNFDANMNATRLSSAYSSVIRVIEAVGIVIVIYEGSIALLNGLISVGILVSFIVYVQQFFNPIVQLSQLYNMYQNSMVGASRIYSIIDSDPEKDTGTEQVSSFSRAIKGSNMRVTYDGSIALGRVSVEIDKGECVAIVGRTGAGKTTLTNVILKFRYPDEGEISIDLKDLATLETRSYRKLIVPVLQEPFLFNGSIFENIEYSKSGITREELRSLIEIYGMNDIFHSLPKGIDSPVGEMGRNLSEGQRQAVSILRAFVRNPDIIIMDEATAQIDSKSEKNIITAMRNFAKNGTLILISHRFSLITLSDRIIVLEKGNVVQEGKLDQLVNQDGVFRELYKRSVSAYLRRPSHAE